MQGDGAWLQAMQVADIADQGSTVTLGDGKTTAPALFISDPKDFQKYFPSDGQLMGRGKLSILFVFDGTQLGNVNESDTLTFNGTAYTVDAPVHPQIEQGVCIALAALCFIP
jgi:hypothetical protein